MNIGTFHPLITRHPNLTVVLSKKALQTVAKQFLLVSDRAGIRHLCVRVDQECHHDRILECLYSDARLFDQECTLFRFEACPVDINSAAIEMNEGIPALA